jgi:tetratricopeptide (TPR) repeat protein
MVQQNLPDFDSLWDYSNPAETETRFRDLLPQISESEPAHLELLTQIARTNSLRQKFDEAHQILDQVEKQLDETPKRPKIRYLLERGRTFNSSGQPEQAQPLFEQALDIAQQLGEDFYAVDALHMLAIVAPPASALDLNLRAIQMAESSGQEKARNWLGSLYNNTGWSYHDMGEYESALKIFQKAEAYFRSKGRVRETRIAVWTVARCLRSLKRIEEALSMQMKLKEEFDFAGDTDGYVFEEIGECLHTLGRAEEAKPYFTHAYDELSKDTWLTKNEPERLNRLKELGQVKR